MCPALKKTELRPTDFLQNAIPMIVFNRILEIALDSFSHPRSTSTTYFSKSLPSALKSSEDKSATIMPACRTT